MGKNEPMQLRELVEFLKYSYTGFIGWELSHINERTRLNWMREKAEGFKEYKDNIPVSKKKKLLKRLCEVYSFEE